MTLRLILTDGDGIQGLAGVFGSFLTTASTQTAADVIAANAAVLAAQTQAGNASAQAAAANGSAFNAANSATAAALSASQAGASASQAGASQVAASSSAAAAAQSATNVAGSASGASVSATAASSSAAAASNSAGQAANSATAAASSASAAAGFKFATSVFTAGTSVTLDATIAGKAAQFYGTAAATFTLPSETSLAQGQAIWFFNHGSAQLTIACPADSVTFIYVGSKIQSLVLNPGESAVLVARGPGGEYDLIGGSALDQYLARHRFGQTVDDGSSTIQAQGAIKSNNIGFIFPDGSGQSSGSGRNRIINGAMNVAQRPSNAGLTGTTSGFGQIDRFPVVNNGAGGTLTPGIGSMTIDGVVHNSMKLTATAVLNDLSAAKYWNGIEQRIEAVNCYDLCGVSYTVISFYFRASVAGTYSVRNQAFGSSPYACIKNFSYPVANAIQKVTLVFPQLPSAGAFGGGTGIGFLLSIGSQNNGSYITSTLDAWQAGTFICGTGFTTWGLTAGATIEATKIQYEGGSIASIFERIPYQEIVFRCQRYFSKTFPNGTPPANGQSTSGALFLLGGNPNSNQYNGAYWNYSTLMRQTPGILCYEPIATANPGSWYDQATGSVSSPGQIAAGDRGTLISISNGNSVAIGANAAWYIHATADAEL